MYVRMYVVSMFLYGHAVIRQISLLFCSNALKHRKSCVTVRELRCWNLHTHCLNENMAMLNQTHQLT